MKRLTIIACLLFVSAGTIVAQNTVLARGNPPLTELTVSRLCSVYETLLGIRLSTTQIARVRQGLVKYWVDNNRDGISSSLANVRYFNSPDQLSELRSSSQLTIVESLRRDAAATHDMVSAVLIEAYDQAHPNMRGASRAKTLADLVGTWKRQDALLADRNPNTGAVTGVSYTDSGTLQITEKSEFTFVRVHNHCGGGCCRLDGSEEFGTLSLESGKMDLRTGRGSKLIEDGCLGRKLRTACAPHSEAFAWSIRTGETQSTPTLCLTSSDGKSECYEKQ